MMAAGDRQPDERPWDRQPRESETAYAAFRSFLEQAPRRNMARLQRELGVSLSLLWRWHRRHRWKERALAYDQEMAREREADLRRDRRQLVERQLRRAEEADAVGRLLLRRGVPRDPHSGEVHGIDEAALKCSERLLKLATEVEVRCLAGGEPEASATGIEEEVWRLEDGALRRLIDLARGPGERVNEEESHDGPDDAEHT